jgi:hypothetical protein
MTTSWNKVSNFHFVKSPAGVGWPYSNTTSDYTCGEDFGRWPQEISGRFHSGDDWGITIHEDARQWCCKMWRRWQAGSERDVKSSSNGPKSGRGGQKIDNRMHFEHSLRSLPPDHDGADILNSFPTPSQTSNHCYCCAIHFPIILLWPSASTHRPRKVASPFLCPMENNQ